MEEVGCMVFMSPRRTLPEKRRTGNRKSGATDRACRIPPGRDQDKLCLILAGMRILAAELPTSLECTKDTPQVTSERMEKVFIPATKSGADSPLWKIRPGFLRVRFAGAYSNRWAPPEAWQM